jgi:Zn-dependent protease
MISSTFVLRTALLVVFLLCLQLLRRAGSGREIVTISRRSQADVETSWTNLRDAWEKTGLTFMVVDIEEYEDGARRIVSHLSPQAGSIVVRHLPADTSHAIAFVLVSENGVEFSRGRDQFERWSVEPDGTGSRIVVETRFAQRLGGTVRTLWNLRKRAGLLASPEARLIITALDVQRGSNSPQASAEKMRAPAAVARKAAPTKLPSYYGREAAISLIAFAYLLTQHTWESAVVLALVILWHEYGHLLAYRLTGKTGNRLMLVPFFGGIAVAGAPHKSEFEKAFCALMGPGICAPLTIASFAWWYYTEDYHIEQWTWRFLYFSSVLNLLNLLPIYPLDGGQTAESFLRSFLPGSIMVHLSGLSVVGLVVLAGFGYYEMIVFLGIFCLMGLRTLPPHSPLPAMTSGQAWMMATLYAIIAGAHGWVFYYIQ